MSKKKLFSIGEFSKITGVSIKSLHYYESLGILSPAYVDPSNGYRYYAMHQIHRVELIEMFLDFHLRLNCLPNFTSSDFTEIDYENILSTGRENISKELEQLENKMRYIDFLQENLNHKEQLEQGQSIQCHQPSALPIWLLPYDENTSSLSTEDVFKRITTEIRQYNLRFRHTFGRILFSNGNEQRLYYFIDLKLPEETTVFHENIFYLPTGNYQTIRKSQPCLESAPCLFKDLFALSQNRIVLEIMQTQTPNTTTYVLSCLLPQKTPVLKAEPKD